MKKRKHSRLLALTLVMSLVLSLVLPVLPSPVSAAEAITASKVAPEAVTEGTYLIYGTSSQQTDDGTTSAFMSVTNSTDKRLMSKQIPVQDNTVTTDDPDCLWKLIATEGGFHIQNIGNGKYLYYADGSKNSIAQTDQVKDAGVWAVVANNNGHTLQETTFQRQISCNRFGGQGSYYLGFATYASDSSTPRVLEFYKVNDGEVVPPVPTEPQPTETAPTDPVPTETAPTIPETDTVPIADALAGEAGTSFTVKGVVTLVDGKNLYLQDKTGGICLRVNGIPNVKLGDTVIGTGKRADYNGLPQLSEGTCEVSSGLVLTPKAVTIGSLTTADICTYVKLSGLEITQIDDNNGQFKQPNVTLKDETGSTIKIYKAVINKTDGVNYDFKVGDVVDVTAAVGINNSTIQLRNTDASEIVAHVDGPADPITDDMIGQGVLTVKQAGEAAQTGVTVIGQVVYHYGKNFNGSASVDSIILEDVIDGEIYGFQVYDYTNYADYKVGDVVTVTGDIVEYGGIKQMKFPQMTVVKEGVEPIGAQEITVSQLGADYLSEYVHLSDITLGTYNAQGATPVSDATGETTLFKGVPLPAGAAESNVTGIFACCSAFNGKPQLRNGSSDDYETNLTPPPSGGLPADGTQVMIYNLGSKGVLALQDDNTESPSITNAGAQLAEGKVSAANGGLVFTVEQNGEYYRFHNETFGYLCSNGTGNNAFYSKDASDDADWKLNEGKKGGWHMESRTAKFNGKYSQYLEFYAGAYKTYSMNKVTDYDIFEFFFYPTANDKLTEGVVNEPVVNFGELPNAYVGMDYTFTFIVEAVFGVDGELTVTAGDTTLKPNAEGMYTLPKEKVTGDKLTITVTGVDTKGVAISGTAEVTVLDEPVIGEVTPKANSETGDNKRPEISALIANAGKNPTVTLTVNGEAVNTKFADGKVSYTPDQDMADGKVTVKVSVKREDNKEATKSWSFTVGKAQYQLYFGQLHSHTTYSDGSGSLDSALEYVKNLPESANVDFVAFTDHSNYFDKSGEANPEGSLYDMSKASAYSQQTWKTYKDTIANFNSSQTDVVAIGGFEMTWSGGPGHINTFNTPGIVSRNNATLNNKTNDAGMKAYYSLLSQPEGADSLSQFNHPGSTFGTFSDFAYWDALIDTRIQMVEVGNGEGAIGAGGYYPSYEYYTMALDKGWHVAPTNNQDNHKGKWGNANDARDVVLTDDFSEQGLYDAIRNMRMYATEDKNLEIYYDINGNLLGSSMTEVPEKLNVNIHLSDPDSSDSIRKVELIVNSGKIAYTWDDASVLSSGDLSCELDPTYSYYYVRVTQSDGDLAVTAPVWVGESLKLGISNLTCSTSTPVTGEELTLNTTLFNSESSPAQVKSVTYTINGGEVIGTDTNGYEIPASGTVEIPFKYVPQIARVCKITATVVVVLNGEEYTFTKNIDLDIQDSQKLVYLGIDASHFNEYVSGNYKDSMGNFTNLAAGYGVRTVMLNTSEDLINACSNPQYKAILLTAPSRRDGDALRDPYKNYSDEEINAIVGFNDNGGSVIVAGWSDYYEHYASFPAEDHMAAQQNKLLAALGSSLRISDDGTMDDSLNGGQPQRLYLNTYGDSFLTDRVEVDPEHPNDRLYTEVFSQYGGASIYAVSASGNPTDAIADTVSPVVYGHSSTYSKDSDNDGLGGDQIPKYAVADSDSRLMLMASEQMDGKGLIIVSGAAFMSNFEVQAQIEDSGSEKNYSNYKICENLLNYLNPVHVTPIADVQAEENEGVKFTIEGVVTSNASGYDKDTAFFDCIYVQDETGGINAFPVAGNYKIGDKVRISGTTSSYQGERQIAVKSIEKIGEGTVTAKDVTAQQINDGSVLGQLVTLKGYVTSFEKANGLVQTIMVKDSEGNTARVFIDGYITTGKEVENLQVGCEVTVTGCASYDNTFNAPDGPFARIRIRDRADVICGDLIHEHSWSDWKLEKEPTCTEDGFEVRTCSCGGQEKNTIPALGHDWGEWKVTKEPTAEENGEKVRSCNRCHHEEKVVLPATGGGTKPTDPSTPTDPSVPGDSSNPTVPNGNRPSTGDQSNAMLWTVLILISAAGIVSVVVSIHKKKK